MIEFVKQKKELHKMLADLAREAQNDVRQEDSKEKENDENQIVHHLSAPSAKFANKYAMTIWKRMDRK